MGMLKQTSQVIRYIRDAQTGCDWLDGETYRNDRATSRSSWMRSSANDILPREQPVSPAEAAYVVKRLEKEDHCLLIFHGELTNGEFLGLFTDMLEECTVGFRSIVAELVQDLGQWCGGHGNLEEVV